MRVADIIARALCRAGTPRLLDRGWGSERLTVLAYHRITDATPPDFSYFRKNVSASPQLFERQLQYILEHFNVIDLATLRDHLFGHQPLPPRSLLITFDDGYSDNYTHAYPLLRRYDLPAVIFLTVGYLDDPTPPWWDRCAYCFHHTRLPFATIPLIGERPLSTRRQRASATEWLIRRLKEVSEADKQAVMQALPELLSVPAPGHDRALFLSWDQVREMQANGISCQSHTRSHPILTRVSAEEAYRELVDSRRRIELETGGAVDSFAYPNGTPRDYNDRILQLLGEAGYRLAFTLVPGPMRFREARTHPLEIRRVYLGYQDSFDLFVLKVTGLANLVSRARRLL